MVTGFFRGISYALVGDQEQFEETRNMITYCMAQNKKKIDKIFGPVYLNKSSMELDGIWATEAEIFSAAGMLNTDVHIYCNPGNENKWLKYKSVILGEKPVTTKSIFLDNSKGNHFDYVSFL